MSLKADYITDLRAVPDGLQAFLTTAIPLAPMVATPTTVDSAIIVQGVLAAFLLDVFRPFGGLTPVELLLRIGQHNSVGESLLLTVLEYLEDANAQQDFKVVFPEAGQSYAAGVFVITCQVTNGTAKRLTAFYETDGAEKNQDLVGDSKGYFQGAITMMTPGEYTVVVTADFAQKNTTATQPVTKTMTFTVAASDTPSDEPPQPPGGQDLQAVEKIIGHLAENLKQVTAAVAGNMTDAAAQGLQRVDQNVTQLEGVLKAIGGNLPDLIQTMAANVFTSVRTAVSAAATNITSGAANAADLADAAIGDVATGITTLKALIGKYL